MPNKRKDGKQLLGGFFEGDEARAFKERAKEMGMTVKDLLGLLIREELKKHRKELNDEQR